MLKETFRVLIYNLVDVFFLWYTFFIFFIFIVTKIMHMYELLVIK